MQLCIESRRVNYPLPGRILTLKQYRAVLFLPLLRRRNLDRIAQEITQVGSKLEQRGIRGIFRLLDLRQAFCSFETETGEDAFGLLERFVCGLLRVAVYRGGPCGFVGDVAAGWLGL